MEELDIKIGQKLKCLREESGLSMREAARRIDIDHTYISKIEKGLMPSLEKLKKLCSLYGITIRDLFDGDEQVGVPDGLKALGVEWIAHVNKMKGQHLTPEEIEKMVNIIKSLKEL